MPTGAEGDRRPARPGAQYSPAPSPRHHGEGRNIDGSRGRFLGFHRLIARRDELTDDNLYDTGLGVRVGVDN